MKLLLFVIVLATAVPAFAGFVGTERVTSYTRWKSGCSKPHKPNLDMYNIDNVDSYNSAVRALNSYIDLVNSYTQCVQNEAHSDAETLFQSVRKGSKKAIDDISSEVRSVRSELKRSEHLLD